ATAAATERTGLAGTAHSSVFSTAAATDPSGAAGSGTYYSASTPAGGLPPAPPEAPPSRWWSAPWIATGIAAIALLLLSFPGVLVYPSAPLDTSARDAFEEQRLRASNDSLEAQLRAMQDALGSNQCRPANFVLPVPNLPAAPVDPDGKAATAPSAP